MDCRFCSFFFSAGVLILPENVSKGGRTLQKLMNDSTEMRVATRLGCGIKAAYLETLPCLKSNPRSQPSI